jgi:hypothetical protein
LPDNRGRRFEPKADTAILVDVGALGGNAPDDILGGQYHVATLTRSFANRAIIGVKRFSTTSLRFSGQSAD